MLAQLVKNHLQCRRLQFDSWVRKMPWRRDRLPTLVFLGFPFGSTGKESTCNAGDPDSIPGLGICAREEIGFTPVFLGFCNGSATKESACNVGDLGLIPG